jgi:hypothetical protein
MNKDDIERRAINKIHSTYPVDALLDWIYERGVPAEVVDKAIKAVWPSDPAFRSLLREEDIERRIAAEDVSNKGRSKKGRHRPAPLHQEKDRLFRHWQCCLRRYSTALNLALAPQTVLSGCALALYGLMLREYLYRGYFRAAHIGSVYATLQLNWIGTERADEGFSELESLALIQRTRFQVVTYELIPSVRYRLLTHFRLTETLWRERASQSFNDIDTEVKTVARYGTVPSDK